jgi:hypothetical protein
VFADRGIAGVCEGAGLSVAETGNIVFVAAEVLLFCGSAKVRVAIVCGFEELLDFKGAELLVDHLPNNLI